MCLKTDYRSQNLEEAINEVIERYKNQSLARDLYDMTCLVMENWGEIPLSMAHMHDQLKPMYG